jgi:hypothetical protein
MTFKKLLLVLSAFAGAAAFAQAPLGSVASVNGVVTATQGATGMTVSPGTPIQNGMRFVTTTNASVTLRMNSGCVVNVPAGHSVTVLQSMTCQQLAEAVQPVPTTTAMGQSSDNTFVPGDAIVNGTIALGAIGIVAGAANLSSGTTTTNQPLSGQ